MREIKFRAWDTKRDRMMSTGFRFDDERYDVMQYTGLKDKNGKEIYEGDVVADGYHDKYGRYEVKWHGVGWNFVSTDGRELEAIGNIYENPDLIGDKK